MKADGLPAAVVFDMDGVLADTEPLHCEAYVGIWNEMGLACTLEDYRRCITMGRMAVHEMYAALGGDASVWQSVMDAKHKRVEQMLSERDVLRPGVVELLRALKAAGTPTAIATIAGRRSMEIILGRFELRGYFDKFVTWQDITRPKPDPEVYQTAAARLGVPCEHCAAIEDSPRGVTAAIRAGMKCVAVPTASTADGDFSLATVTVASLELVDLNTLRDLFRPDRS